MRKLMWMGAGFTAACLLGAYLLSGSWLLIFGACLLVASVGLLLLFREVCWQRAVAFAALGLGVGMVWFWLFSTLALAPARNVDGQSVTIRGEATDYSYATDYGTAVEAKLTLEDGSFRGKLYLDGQQELSPGDRVEGEFLLCYTGPEGENSSEYHSGTGAFLLGYQRGDVSVVHQQDASLKHFPARLRRDILQSVEGLFPADTAAFAKALLLGDTTDIDYETDTSLTASGIVHVVSVSGLHVSILFSLLFLVLGRRKYLTPIVGALVLLLMAAVTGFSPSIVRSCLMNGLMLFALMAEREYDPLTALAFAMVVMLGINPLSVTSVGLQLSAASVLGINLFSGSMGDWIRTRNFWADAKRGTVLFRLREWLAPTVSVSLSAAIATAPLTALHFGTVSIVGLLTNLAVLWVVNYVFIGILFCVIFGLFWTWGAEALAWLLSWGIRYVLYVAKLLGGFPLAAVYTESPYIVAWLVCAYGMLGLFLAMKRKRRLQLCLWITVSFLAALSFSYIEPRLDDLRVTVLDVGQGQCVLLQSGGRTYMVDCGGSHDETTADKAVATLYSQGVFRLDGLILTHYDKDHVGGAAYLLSRVPVEQVYLPVGPGQGQWEQTITEAASGECIYVLEDQTICWSGAQISVFAASSAETSNESSLCVLFQKENYDILITGDQNVLGEMALLAENNIPKLEALVVGHHGSNSSTGDFLLEQTRPDMALISVGADNIYGHPSQSVLARLEEYGCIIRRTDLEGTIIIRR